MTPMMKEVFEERLATKLANYRSTAEALAVLVPKLMDPLTNGEPDFKEGKHSKDRLAIAQAEVQLRVAANEVEHLLRHLYPYSDPDFYKEMIPSLAKDDQGRHAASAVEYVLSE